MEKRTKRNGFRLGILMLCTVMLLFAVMPTGVLASDNILSDVYWKLFGKSGADVFLTEFSGQNCDVWDIDSNYQDKNVIDYEYVIFDDDTDFLLGQKDNFIKVNQNTGLTKREINKAIKILTRLKE